MTIKKKRGRPSNFELERRKEEIEKNNLIKIMVGIGLVLMLGVLTQSVWADQITHKFKSPSFNGVNTSSHYLTIENQEFNRKQTIKDELKAAIEEAERDKENSTVQRFIRNFESRVYAELSRQLIANLFGETPSDSGIISLGTVTIITIPIGSFTF